MESAHSMESAQPTSTAAPEIPVAAPQLSLFPQSSATAGDRSGCGIFYHSRRMHDLINKAIAFARSSANVLITGENGCGKELFAKLIHNSSPRSNERFARINCAALSENLIESELFGHEKGAFTGADSRRIGRFEWAEKGTLLLDEISEIPVATQAKMLRVLEENEYQRIGSNETIRSDVRVVATSNRDLTDMVGLGEFRQDLYFRLNVLRIHLPSLRERPEDIPLLANLFLQKHRHEAGKPITGFDKKALAAICSYAWPGNVRELRNAILHACIVAQSETIGVDDLPELGEANRNERVPCWMLSTRLDEIERQVILENLKRAGGNKTIAAEILGVTTRTLANKLKLYREQGLANANLPAAS